MRLFTFLLAVTLVFSPALARNYRIVAVGDYGGSANLSNADADTFDEYMGNGTFLWFFKIGNGWTKEGDYRDSAVNKSVLAPKKKVDYVYFTGHGSEKYFCLPDWHTFYPSDLGKTQNVKHLIGACCLVGRNNDWARCFGNGLKSFLSYRETSFDRIDVTVAKSFAKEISSVEVNDSYGHILAWAKANNISTQNMKNRWIAYGYDKDGKLYTFYNDNGKRADTRNRARPNHNIYDFEEQETLVFGDGRVVITADIDSLDRNINRRSDKGDDGDLDELQPLAATPVPVDLSSLSMLSGATRNSAGLKRGADFSEYDDHHTYDLPDGGFLAVTNRGALFMSRNISQLEESSLDDSSAMDLAMNFIEENGGLPDGATFAGIDRLVKERHGEKITVGHAINFEHEIDGMPVGGTMADGISIILAGDQVASYYRSWNNPQAGKLYRRSSRRNGYAPTARQLIVNAQKELIASIKGEGTVNIVAVENGYASPKALGDPDGPGGFTPVIRLIMDDGGYIQIDRETGKIIW